MMQRTVPNWFVGSPFFPTPGAQNSPGCREMSQTGLWWVFSYNNRRTVQEKRSVLKWLVVSPFLQRQELRTVKNAEGCPRLVCSESFSYNTMSLEMSMMQTDVPNWFVVSPFLQHQELRSVQDAEGCPKLVCGESFLTTPEAQISPECWGLS